MKNKKKTETVLASKLIISKEEFERQIKDRITKGRELFKSRKKENIFFSEYDKWNKFNIELLERKFDIPNNKYKKEYEEAANDPTDILMHYEYSVIQRKESINRQIEYLEILLELISQIPTTLKTVKNKTKDEDGKGLTNKIFIVHGHNNEIKQLVARTLTQLKLEPIILHERAEQGKTIIEKFEHNSSDVNFAIILLTADDEGKAKKETDYKTRARQNVVFEMGYFIGKLGREKVFLLLENGVDKPGDLDGIVYVPIDSNDGWKLKLVKELKVAGYNVSADDL